MVFSINAANIRQLSKLTVLCSVWLRLRCDLCWQHLRVCGPGGRQTDQGQRQRRQPVQGRELQHHQHPGEPPEGLRQDWATQLSERGADQGQGQHPDTIHGTHFRNADGETIVDREQIIEKSLFLVLLHGLLLSTILERSETQLQRTQE